MQTVCTKCENVLKAQVILQCDGPERWQTYCKHTLVCESKHWYLGRVLPALLHCSIDPPGNMEQDRKFRLIDLTSSALSQSLR